MSRSQQQFELIILPEAARLLRFARRLTGDTPAAEDLVQETLLKAWRKLHQFREGSGARAWVFRILVNSFYAKGRKPRAFPEPARIERASNPAVIEKVAMEQALDALPEEHRSVLLLAVVEGFTCREISAILSIPMGTVMSRLSRARAGLREKLAPERSIAAARGQRGLR